MMCYTGMIRYLECGSLTRYDDDDDDDDGWLGN